jgi:hypothetical protein
MRRYFSKGAGAVFTGNGAAAGLVTVASTAPFFANAYAWISDQNSPSIRVQIAEIVSSTTLRVRKIWTGESGVGVRGDSSFADVSAYTVAQTARIDMEPQLVEDPSQSA